MKNAMRGWLDTAFEALLPSTHVRLSEGLRQRLVRDPITIADVGAVFGPDPRWLQLGERTCRFLTFEPDKRSLQEGASDGPFEQLALPTALGKEPGREKLYLTKGEFASSLYPPNKEVLAPYCTWPWHEIVDEDEVSVDTLDNCLDKHPDWKPDFIKTDVEGADLDVLVSGEKTLSGALGLQVEAAFVERNVGAPLFAEIDQFLRAKGFTLFQLVREHWQRSNGVGGPMSRSQLIWADVMYFREIDEFSKRLDAASDTAAREALVLKFVAMLLVYGHHDFAMDVAKAAIDAAHCEEAFGRELCEAIETTSREPRGFTLRGGVALLIAGAIRLAALPFGAAARRQTRELYQRQACRVYDHLYRKNARSGLQQGCISDLP